MYKVTTDKFHKGYCNRCIYKDVCCEAYKVACFNGPNERLDFLASMVYGKPTHVVKDGDSN